MTFTVTYRDRSGAKREEALEATSRTACVAACRARGIVALAIREGDGVKGESRRTKGRNSRAGSPLSAANGGRKIVVWVTLVACVSFATLVLWWWLAGERDASPCQTDSPAKHKAPKIVKAPDVPQAPKVSKAVPVATPAARQSPPKPVVGQPSISTNAPSTNNVVYIVPPIDPNDPDMALRSRTSQEIGSLLSITPGDPVPPFPYSFILEDDAKKQGDTASNGNDMFLESLRKMKIQAKDTDSEAVAKHKEAIVTAQMDLLDGIKEGLSVNDSIRAAYEFRVRAYEYREGLKSSLREWAEENPTREDFAKALAEINNKLKEEGIKAIPTEEVMPELEEDDK